jgi:hypothetical protein
MTLHDQLYFPAFIPISSQQSLLPASGCWPPQFLCLLSSSLLLFLQRAVQTWLLPGRLCDRPIPRSQSPSSGSPAILTQGSFRNRYNLSLYCDWSPVPSFLSVRHAPLFFLSSGHGCDHGHRLWTITCDSLCKAHSHSLVQSMAPSCCWLFLQD